MSRKKLVKLLGKEVEYTATVGIYSDNIKKLCLVDVKHNGKVYTDHVWAKVTDRMAKYKKGDKIRFYGTAYTYTDSKKIRKHGLHKLNRYMLLDEQFDVAMNDTEERLKRIR